MATVLNEITVYLDQRGGQYHPEPEQPQIEDRGYPNSPLL